MQPRLTIFTQWIFRLFGGFFLIAGILYLFQPMFLLPGIGFVLMGIGLMPDFKRMGTVEFPFWAKAMLFLIGFALVGSSEPVLTNQPPESKANPTTLSGSIRIVPQVVSQMGGDSIAITMEDGTREWIRILGIDAPKRGECFYEKTMKKLQSLIEGREILLQLSSDERQQKNELLRYVEYNGEDIGLRLIEEGYVKASVNDHPRLAEYRRTERQARMSEKGLWKECTDS